MKKIASVIVVGALGACAQQPGYEPIDASSGGSCRGGRSTR
jgi:hypothetical protein